MTNVTKILSRLEFGDPHAAEQLLPRVYDELRRLAARRLAQERPGQTLQATALVHEAYLRLVDVENSTSWQSRRHFFCAAAEAMRRILVESARRKKRLKRGGTMRQITLDDVAIESPASTLDMLGLDEALQRLAREEPKKAEIVQLRYFVGLERFSN